MFKGHAHSVECLAEVSAQLTVCLRDGVLMLGCRVAQICDIGAGKKMSSPDEWATIDVVLVNGVDEVQGRINIE